LGRAATTPRHPLSPAPHARGGGSDRFEPPSATSRPGASKKSIAIAFAAASRAAAARRPRAAAETSPGAASRRASPRARRSAVVGRARGVEQRLDVLVAQALDQRGRDDDRVSPASAISRRTRRGLPARRRFAAARTRCSERDRAERREPPADADPQVGRLRRSWWIRSSQRGFPAPRSARVPCALIDTTVSIYIDHDMDESFHTPHDRATLQGHMTPSTLFASAFATIGALLASMAVLALIGPRASTSPRALDPRSPRPESRAHLPHVRDQPVPERRRAGAGDLAPVAALRRGGLAFGPALPAALLAWRHSISRSTPLTSPGTSVLRCGASTPCTTPIPPWTSRRRSTAPGGRSAAYAAIAAMAIAIGPSPAGFAVYRTASALNALLEHSNLRAPRWLDTLLSLVTTWPHMHKVHHSRVPEETDTNYGNLFSLWDRLFGTYTPSHRGRTIATASMGTIARSSRRRPRCSRCRSGRGAVNPSWRHVVGEAAQAVALIGERAVRAAVEHPRRGQHMVTPASSARR